jgi:hypothetical protein
MGPVGERGPPPPERAGEAVRLLPERYSFTTTVRGGVVQSA